MKIVFAGDYGFGKITDSYDKEFTERVLAEPKAAMADADFRMLNMEKLFYNGDEPIVKSGPNIGVPKESVDSLKYMGIDAVGLAHNHTGDFGESAVLFNIEYLKENGIRYAGAGKNIDEAYLPLLFEKDGECVSVITICENEFGIAEKNKAGAAGYNFYRTQKLIKEEKAKGRYTVIFFHGGNEENPYPSPGKRDIYRFFIEHGADAVIAMHTHCPQGFETYLGKPIVYSMGNFFFSSSNPTGGLKVNPDCAFYYGYMSSLEFKDGKVSFEPLPYKFSMQHMEMLKGERKERFLRHLAKLSEPIGKEGELERLFRGWSLITGPVYAAKLNYTPDAINNKELSRHIKNDFSCEAHNELLVSYINMCYHGITAEDEQCRDDIKKLWLISID